MVQQHIAQMHWQNIGRSMFLQYAAVVEQSATSVAFFCGGAVLCCLLRQCCAQALLALLCTLPSARVA
jgi:hypothetical protein